jgi:hypothetical protein
VISRGLSSAFIEPVSTIVDVPLPKVQNDRMARGAGALACLIGLWWCSAATAKGPDLVRLCGMQRCHTSNVVERVNRLALYDGFRQRSAPVPAPYYRVALTSTRLQTVHWVFEFVPSRRAVLVLRATFESAKTTSAKPFWATPTPAALREYQQLARGLTPFPAPKRWTAVAA